MTGYFSAADRNKEPIRQALASLLPGQGSVLEIGSGTGQHAVYFAQHFQHLHWVTSDRQENHSAIRSNLESTSLDNLAGPLLLDVAQDQWPSLEVQAVYSSNTCHIMAWEEVLAMFRGVSGLLPDGGRFLIYGPFNLDGKFTSQSNREFDAGLRQRAPHMGVRDLGALEDAAAPLGLSLATRMDMPANNMLLCWKRGKQNG